MEKEKNNKVLIIALLVIIILLGALCALLATGTISLKNSKVQKNNTGAEVNGNNTTEYTQDTFKKIVDDELYVLFGYKSLNELPNKRKLTLAFNKAENENSNCNNDVCSTVDYISKSKLEEAFNKTSLAKLGINHESYDVYTLSDNKYVRNQQVMSKRNLFNCDFPHKVENFEKSGNKYVISVKYLFTDACPVNEYYYGAYASSDQSETNRITNAFVGDNYTDYVDPKKYLDENYDSIKDKLDTYIYTFEVNNGKIELVDFSIN